MTARQEEFKTRLIAVLADLRDAGSKDPEAMFLLGSLASDLAANMKATSWSAAKSRMNRTDYDVLLSKFQSEGNAHHKAGRIKHAYAMQALGLSLIAPTQPDPQVAQGGALLDGLIDRSVLVYRNRQAKAKAKAS